MEMSNYVDYMDGFDEGKNDDNVKSSINNSPKQNRRTNLMRRKKTLKKQRRRLTQLSFVTGDKTFNKAVHGKIRNHQLKFVKNSIDDPRVKYKRREDLLSSQESA